MINLDELKAKVVTKKNELETWAMNHQLATGAILTAGSTLAAGVLYVAGYKKGVKDCSTVLKAYDLGYKNGQK